jgi:hypothetical protein
LGPERARGREGGREEGGRKGGREEERRGRELRMMSWLLILVVLIQKKICRDDLTGMYV